MSGKDSAVYTQWPWKVRVFDALLDNNLESRDAAIAGMIGTARYHRSSTPQELKFFRSLSTNFGCRASACLIGWPSLTKIIDHKYIRNTTVVNC